MRATVRPVSCLPSAMSVSPCFRRQRQAAENRVGKLHVVWQYQHVSLRSVVPEMRANQIFLVVSATTGLALCQLMNQFVNYAQIKPLLYSPALAENMEYVVMSHPGFECICYWLDSRVMSVKLSINQSEKYVLVPEADWNEVLARLESRQIPVVAVN